MIMPTPSVRNVFLFFMLLFCNCALAQEGLKVAIAGLSHDHVNPLLNAYQRHEVNIVGIAEADKALIRRVQDRYKLTDELFYTTVDEMLKAVKPDVVLAYNAISEHVDVAEACLPLKIPLMVEKPLAINNEQAQRIAALSAQYGTAVFTNYETTWYKSNQALKQLVDDGGIGTVKKVIVKDGHQGPKEIGCSEAFLSWLTDPEKNGGGALIDFGCYGANLMTWLMKGERPVAVTAVTRQLKPSVYPNVDDDATIILEYKGGATGVIQASWDWPYSIKDMHVYGDRISLHAVDGNTLVRYSNPRKQENVPVKEDYFTDHLAYLQAALNGSIDVADDLSSLANNLVVVEILQAARESAKRGSRVVL
ncbi:Predicted dehydrogenase [Parapedobacter koreensis]|uniref:Predicted dehydrogenase n=2 Tax=Parapedobacter koreensis TaxID=332977 RepID=A0A1H7IMX4_9SPHI|nr:Predicted dehydrogenase [Parapedobacter koreensis]